MSVGVCQPASEQQHDRRGRPGDAPDAAAATARSRRRRGSCGACGRSGTTSRTRDVERARGRGPAGRSAPCRPPRPRPRARSASARRREPPRDDREREMRNDAGSVTMFAAPASHGSQRAPSSGTSAACERRVAGTGSARPASAGRRSTGRGVERPAATSAASAANAAASPNAARPLLRRDTHAKRRGDDLEPHRRRPDLLAVELDRQPLRARRP